MSDVDRHRAFEAELARDPTRKPDPRWRGPDMAPAKQTAGRSLSGLTTVLLVRGTHVEHCELDGDAYTSICGLVGTPAPDGRYVAWREYGGVQVWYDPTASTPLSVQLDGPGSPKLYGAVVFAGRISLGDIVGLAPAEIRWVINGLANGERQDEASLFLEEF